MSPRIPKKPPESKPEQAPFEILPRNATLHEKRKPEAGRPVDLGAIAYALHAEGAKIVAGALGISLRTLDRWLRLRGTTILALRQRYRRERALELLRTGLGTGHVARLLRFSGPDSFARFCRRELGATAGQLRVLLADGGAKRRTNEAAWQKRSIDEASETSGS